MYVFGQRKRAWRTPRKRGVSPIIATILLVAITVVLAAVLYVLVSTLTTTTASTPYTLGMSESVFQSCTSTASTGTCTIVVGLTASGGLTTSQTAFTIDNLNTGSAATTIAAPAACINGATVSTACTEAAGGWYGVLETQTGTTVVAIYSGASASWSQYPTGDNTITLGTSYNFVIVSAGNNAFGGVAKLVASGNAGASVSGTLDLT